MIAMFTMKKASEKLNQLIKENEQKLGLTTLETFEDEDGTAHILAQRTSDKSYIVWSSYYTGEESTTYASFHNGKYDMDIEQGINELKRRLNRETL